ncbi:MAG: hypothetical protein IT368_09160, partial [Candidatus Hydrogenedentes bacterium]|nr:hypothetical protein [Candidatus Hydrogenedentota bacterium]
MNRITLLNLFVAAFLIAGAMAAAEDATAPAPDDAAAHAAAPAAASPTLFPVPDYTGSLSQRLCLTGDWGGARTQLANHGVQARLGLTQVYQGIARGGLDTRPE